MDNRNKNEQNKKEKRSRTAYLRMACACIIGMLASALLGGCAANTASSQDAVSKTAVLMDTVVTLTVYGEEDAEALLDDCMAYCETLAGKLDNYDENSEISALNAHPNEVVALSDETIEVLQLGETYGAQSDGRFSIRLGAVCKLWNFHDGGETLPDETLLAAAVQAAKTSSLTFGDDNTCTLCTDETEDGASAQIDLGGIAKGYIADCLKTYMEAQDVTSAIINLGGNVLTIGEKPDGSAFVVGIQEPFAADGETAVGVRAADGAVVTSGVYQRYFEIDGTRYHHILDVDTGYPAETDLYSVSILTSSAAKGDALSTICMLYGLEDGLALIEQTPDVEAIFITDENEIVYSSGVTEEMLVSQ